MTAITSADGTRIHLEHLGGSGPLVVLAHATGFCGSVWKPIAAELQEHFSCWTLDFRSHGRSGEPLGGDYVWARVAEDLLALIDEVAPNEKWLGAGHSMGGAALLMCEQMRPGLFDALWAYEPIVMPPAVRAMATPDTPNPLAESARRRRPGFDSRTAARDNYASKPPMNAFAPEALTAYLETGLVDLPDGSVELACKPENESKFYLMGSEHTTFDQLGSVSAPTTIVRGLASGFGPADFAGDVVDALPNGTLEVHDALSHFGPMEDPIAMAASIARAFGGRPSTSGATS